ncbi:MAG: DUF72 domain-containing protein [Planctomycetota bacterium]
MTCAACRVGTSGWVYRHWRGTFYPEELPQKQWFRYYAERFATVELNKTFYSLPSEKTVQDWQHLAPAGFQYAVKYSRFGTHNKKLKDPDSHLDRFMTPVRHLAGNLGPVLVQLPPRWAPNTERLREFLDALGTQVDRIALEIRDPRWFRDDVLEVCRQRNVCLVIHDMIEDHPQDRTADFSYFRFHGEHYRGSYDDDALRQIADQAAAISDDGNEVYIYFNNDEACHAAHNALHLQEMLAERACPRS